MNLAPERASKVAVNINDKGEGKVIIHFTSPGEVDWIVEYFTDEVEM